MVVFYTPTFIAYRVDPGAGAGIFLSTPRKNFETFGSYAAAAAAKLLQSCLTLRDPMYCSLPGFSVLGIFQAGVLEWVAIAFSVGPYDCRINSTLNVNPCIL